eukprot:6172326-Amphidinium_carterae.1
MYCVADVSRSLISDIYAAKRASDKRCDTGKKPRRALHDVVSEVRLSLGWKLVKTPLDAGTL